MKTLLIGVGAAGNKAVMDAIDQGVVEVKDTIIVNSTSKDFPKEYEGLTITISPNDKGCGKERDVAKNYTMTAIKSGKFNLEIINNFSTVAIVSSVEGGTGSGATPILAKFFNQVFKKNVHVFAFKGAEEDVRGLSNTIEFFQEIDPNIIVNVIDNMAFMRDAGYNKFKAEKLANIEMCKRLELITGQKFIDSKQNIDDTDIIKVSNTSGYMTVEHRYLDKALIDQDDFNRVIKKMIYESKSLKCKAPGAVRLGVILNIDPASEDAIDYSFKNIKSAYGNPYECFMQEQWDGEKEYIAFIASGMKMPIEELKAIYERYREQSEQVNKDKDSFFNEIQNLQLKEEDKKFDMIKVSEASEGESVDSFLKQFETK